MTDIEKAMLVDIIKKKQCQRKWSCYQHITAIENDELKQWRELCPLFDGFCLPSWKYNEYKYPLKQSRPVQDFERIAAEIYVENFSEAELFEELL